MRRSLSENLFCNDSLNRKREARKASVAPIVDANETSNVPISTPNIAPPANVRIAAPGNDNPVIKI